MREAIFVTVTIAAALALGRASDGPRQGDEVGVTLTNTRPMARLAIAEKVLRSPPPLLEVSLVRVANKHGMPFSISVYLEWGEGKPASEAGRLLVGKFAPFPANQPGRFVLRVSNAFHELRARGVNLLKSHLALVIEMRRVRDSQHWTPIEVTIAPVRWLREDETGTHKQSRPLFSRTTPMLKSS